MGRVGLGLGFVAPLAPTEVLEALPKTALGVELGRVFGERPRRVPDGGSGLPRRVEQFLSCR